VTLFVTCGLPGSGKTTLAKELETRHDAVRFTPDEWLTNLWDQDARALVEAQMWTTAQHLLRLGVDVVIDFGSWSRAERDVLREGARALGTPVELHYLDLPIDELERRVVTRNREGITRTHLEEWAEVIERPTAAELALFD
jgi:predicted kinase